MPEKCTDPRECPLLPRIEALEREAAHNKEAHKEFYGRLDASRTSAAVFEERLEQIKEDTAEIKSTVQCLKDKPGKRWDFFGDKILWFLIEAVLIFAAVKIGLK